MMSRQDGMGLAAETRRKTGLAARLIFFNLRFRFFGPSLQPATVPRYLHHTGQSCLLLYFVVFWFTQVTTYVTLLRGVAGLPCFLFLIPYFQFRLTHLRRRHPRSSQTIRESPGLVPWALLWS